MGVAIFSKTKPDHVEYGCGIAEYDFEGRVIRADYGDVSVMSGTIRAVAAEKSDKLLKWNGWAIFKSTLIN